MSTEVDYGPGVPSDPFPEYATPTEVGDIAGSTGSISDAIDEHKADDADPHDAAGYQTSLDLSTAIDTHEAASDPHTAYTKQAEVDTSITTHDDDAAAHVAAGFALGADITDAVATHEGLADPHPGYETAAEAQALVDSHSADTTSVHGVTDTALLAVETDISDAVDAHSIDTDPHGDRAYADSVATGLTVKDSVVAATTGNITRSGAQTIDGVAVVAGNRVLVKAQTDPIENGIYAAASGSWARSGDADTTGEMKVGSFCYVSGGTVNATSSWVCNSAGTLNTDPVVFTQFNTAGAITAGLGLTKTGNVVDLVSADSSLTISADSAIVAANHGGSTHASIQTYADSAVTTHGTASHHYSYGPVYNVKDYGAAGDGSTDDSAHIQAALDAVSSTNGGVVVFPPGRYKLVTGLTMTNIPSVHLVGLGGKPFQGDKGRTPQVGGAVLEGATSSMTLLTLQHTSGLTGTHQGPTVENLGFRDQLTITGCVNTSSAVSNITAAAWTTAASGTITYSITTGQIPAGITAGKSIYVYGFKNAPNDEGTTGSYNGRFTVAAVDNVSNPSTITVTGVASPHGGTTTGSASMADSSPVIRIAPSMTLLKISQQTRSYIRRCEFFGGQYGISIDSGGGGDGSWGKIDHCTGSVNDHAIYFGDAPDTTYIDGGNYQYSTGQVGIDCTNFGSYMKIAFVKFDTLGSTARGSYAVKIPSGDFLSMVGNNFELEGDCTAIQLGADGASVVSGGAVVANSMKLNNAGSNGSHPGVGIQVDGTATTDGNASAMTFLGNTFSGYGTCYSFSANTRHCKVIGGSAALVDRGIVNAGIANEFYGFTHWRNNSTTLSFSVNSVVQQSGTTYRYGTTAAHGLAVGDYVTTTSLTAKWNITAQVTAVSDSTHFDLVIPTASGAVADQTGSVSVDRWIKDIGTNTLLMGCHNYALTDTSPAPMILPSGTDLVPTRASLSPSATAGFLRVPSGVGVPTGKPVQYTGTVPMYVNESTGRVYFYINGAWISVLPA